MVPVLALNCYNQINLSINNMENEQTTPEVIISSTPATAENCAIVKSQTRIFIYSEERVRSHLQTFNISEIK